jgi:fructokinase
MAEEPEMYDVCALGELLIDFTPSGLNEEGMCLFARNPGGAPANVLVQLGRLGGKGAFIGKVGEDDFGRFLDRVLQENGVDTAGLIRSPEYNTTLAFVHLNPRGDRSFSFYRRQGADLMLGFEEVNRSLIDNSRIFHFGAVSITGEPCRTTVRRAAEYARERGKILSCDPNYRPLLWKDEAEAFREISALIPFADILKVSEEELALLAGGRDLEKGAALLAAKGPAVVLVTLGPEGAFYYRGGSEPLRGTLPAYSAVKTIDTTGAGDSFFGAFLYRLREKSKADLRVMAKAELEEAVDFANAAGSLTTAKKGAIPAMPGTGEIESLRRGK